MLTVFLRRAQPAVIVFILFFAALLWLPGWVVNNVTDSRETVTGPLAAWIHKGPLLKDWFSRLIMLALLLILGFYTVSLNTRFNFIHERSFLPSFFLVAISGALPESQHLNASVIGSFFFLFALDQVFRTYRYNGISFHFFRAGLLIGLGTLFYPPMMVFVLVIYVGLLYLRTFNWREWLTPLIGFLIPLYFYAGIFYFITGEWELLKEKYFLTLARQAGMEIFTPEHYVFFACLVVLVIISSSHMINRFTSKKVSSRKYLQIIFWSFLISVSVWILKPSIFIDMLVFTALPLSYLFTTFFKFHRTVWWCEILLWIFVLTLGFLQLNPILL